ncbi:hypothetical protein [Planococcus shenhongbingii]|uniref:Uncharacterized protein n=1 Tax=Planococcus shenhongbingii TaxID=3058398 RepID=A0ABT8NBL8_9BACL|nr:hypothetical protein [Planococcus sp. N017]MDN7245275.1 hypothetical protein [Planococcus sp. N017]
MEGRQYGLKPVDITSHLKALEGDEVVYDICRSFEVERDFI